MKKVTYMEDVTVHDLDKHDTTPAKYTPFQASIQPTCPVCGATYVHEERQTELDDPVTPFVRMKSDIDKAI